jgi:phosphatidylglycerophosphatase C
VPESPATRPVVAAFDVDGTLTTEDCVVPFLRRAAGRRLVLGLLRHPVGLARALVRRDRDRLKELACASLAGKDAGALDRLGVEFAREFASRRLREDTTARLRRHRELGHTVILASASFEAYLAPLGAELGVDGVVCTRLERDADERLTGRLSGANCRGPEKARRVREWLAEAGLEGAELWAYGDSPGDAELLAAADHPVRVDGVRIGPDPG